MRGVLVVCARAARLQLFGKVAGKAKGAASKAKKGVKKVAKKTVTKAKKTVGKAKKVGKKTVKKAKATAKRTVKKVAKKGAPSTPDMADSEGLGSGASGRRQGWIILS